MENYKQPAFDWWLNIASHETWAYAQDIFSDEDIDIINNQSVKTDPHTGKIETITFNDGKELLSYRNSVISNIESSDANNSWIFERITDTIIDINKRFWNFDLSRIETLQYSVYDEGQFYKPHIDILYNSPTNAIRKLSFSVLLSDPDEYEGGDLQVYTGISPIQTVRKKGSIVFFPSYVLHEVSEVTKGTRRALVGWVTGPAFR